MIIWFTAGGELFRSLLPLYTRISQVAMLMFSPDDLSSFEQLRVFKETYLDSHDSVVKPRIYLVMAKIDIPKQEWKVDVNEAQSMADEFNAKLHLISSKNNAEEQTIQ
jgi:GTPase SAR1 family protein